MFRAAFCPIRLDRPPLNGRAGFWVERRSRGQKSGLRRNAGRFHNFTIGMYWVVPQTGRTFVSASADMCSARAPLRYREGVTPRVRLKALEKVSGSG